MVLDIPYSVIAGPFPISDAGGVDGYQTLLMLRVAHPVGN